MSTAASARLGSARGAMQKTRARPGGIAGGYDLAVRRLFVLLMIVLLPLRGWAGEIMAVQMATIGMTGESSAGMPPDCHLLMASPSAATDAQDTRAGTDMPSCESCDLCLPMAEVAAVQSLQASFADHVKRAPRGAAFLSVAPAPGFKPPIS
jgi:hypothetical protein